MHYLLSVLLFASTLLGLPLSNSESIPPAPLGLVVQTQTASAGEVASVRAPQALPRVPDTARIRATQPPQAIQKRFTTAASAPTSESAHAQVSQSQTPVDVTTPVPAPATTAQTSPAMASLELAVVAGINAARAAQGLSPLAADNRLAEIARAHSADMLAQNYFSHSSLSGCSAACRYQNAGYGFWAMAENIFWMEGYSLSENAAAQKVVDSWQNSPGHRANDLGDYGHIGVGVAQSGSKVYVTADFATPRQ